MDVEIYMEQPEGFHQGGPKTVCKLIHSIYGSKQGGRMWNKKMHSVLSEMSFKRTYSDHSLYIYTRGHVRIFLPVFVDDMTLASTSKDALEQAVADLSKHFKLRDLGETTQLLGIKIDRDHPKCTISLSQRHYTQEILERFGMGDCKPVSTPMLPGLRLSKDMAPNTPQDIAFMNNTPYLSAVGALMYLATTTRPDIAYTVGVLARFNHNPGVQHWTAVKHLLRYLKGTVDYSLILGPDPSSKELFTTYSDADHGGCKDSGHSTGAYIIKMGSGTVSWSSKLQSLVALSTTEAEYISAVEAGKEICWMRNLVEEMGFPMTTPSVLRIDNQSAISVAKNPEHHGRMKQLDLRFYWLRDKVEEGVIAPNFVPTAEMPADLLTKPLDRLKVNLFCKMMGLERT